MEPSTTSIAQERSYDSSLFPETKGLADGMEHKLIVQRAQ